MEQAMKPAEDALKGTYLTFSVGDALYGLDIGTVTQIINIQEITEIPGQPDYVKGVINLRGQIVPVMEVRGKFDQKAIEYDDRTCIIVVNVDDMAVGLIVDRVSEVVGVPKAALSEVPVRSGADRSPWLEGFYQTEGKVVALLKCEELVSHE